MSSQNQSEIAQFRERQALEEQAALLAMNGFAQVASHDTIVNKFEFDTERVRQLFAEGKDEEALSLWETLQW